MAVGSTQEVAPSAQAQAWSDMSWPKRGDCGKARPLVARSQRTARSAAALHAADPFATLSPAGSVAGTGPADNAVCQASTAQPVAQPGPSWAASIGTLPLTNCVLTSHAKAFSADVRRPWAQIAMAAKAVGSAADGASAA